MADGQQGDDEQAATEAIPAVSSGDGIASTKEIPAVEGPTALTPLVRTNGPASQRFESSPDHASPAPPPGPTYGPAPATDSVYPPLAESASRSAPPAAAAPVAQPAPVPPVLPARQEPGPGRGLNVNAILIGAIVVVLVAIIGVAIWKIAPGDSSPSATPSATPSAAATAVRATVTSYSPSGSGFEQRNGGWTTQTYTSAAFGGLKDWVALVLDLGGKRALTDVTFTANGATVALKSADSTARFGSGSQVGQPKVADGSTTLSGTGGGQHRYWLLYVSKLPASDGGYVARISDIKIHAT